ncbi:MAG TPA: hypothetical protein GXX29_12300 [Firmicutes bacterium]|nr:hypothetical protein [Bacillota bacterium]
MSYRYEVRLLIILSFVLCLCIAGQWWLKHDARRAALNWTPALLATALDAAAPTVSASAPRAGTATTAAETQPVATPSPDTKPETKPNTPPPESAPPDSAPSESASPDTPSSGISASTAAEYQSASLLDINTATAIELQTLPGVGPVIAAEIIKERHRLGGFKTVEDLLGVKGIGPARFARIKPLVTVTPPDKEGVEP